MAIVVVRGGLVGVGENVDNECILSDESSRVFSVGSDFANIHRVSSSSLLFSSVLNIRGELGVEYYISHFRRKIFTSIC